MKVIIIDDESLAREIIKKYLSDFPKISVIAECSNGFEGVKAVNDLKPDLLFLDIQMPKLSGFELLELLEKPPAIIFTTAFDQFAIKAFEVNAIDYLLKPFPRERFAEALNKAITVLNKNQSKPLDELVEYADKAQKYIDKIIIKINNRIIITPVAEIVYLEARDDYVMIYTPTGKYLKQKTMKFYEARLNPSDFIRIHRSYIINVSFIKNIELYEKDTYRVTLKTNSVLPVSKSGFKRVKQFIGNN
ncbi:MAG: response regulator [Ignavibacteriales bacterium]|jgi:two-component system LytT family response regulator|nr:LytTR family transcriptional regulator DNA-binding domain-containing protein [Ignavibacteriaceae bacterium]NLH61256.1 response regulator [Ignavibacteriales bacterium]HOJ17233.1 LytTR family transcriptional regulator DNA-binding domain-containing protein [Ignavibacteriaceae bacterium]HPO54422.1 LytTR family transcriptional regulator DNA-binding domain-containing protein [Ignavibacteriaceae bacterium]